MKSASELRLDGKDPTRGRGYRKARPNSDDVPCWACVGSKKRERGGRLDCVHGKGVVGTLYTCDLAKAAWA